MRPTSEEGKTGGRQWMALTLPLEPVPASRPRVTKWGTYYGKTYKAYMRQADETIPPAPFEFSGNLTVTVEFVCRKPKTTKRECPRGDIDNHCKSILDALTKKGYWNDDDQIVHLYAHKRWPESKEIPHTRVRIESE